MILDPVNDEADNKPEKNKGKESNYANAKSYDNAKTFFTLNEVWFGLLFCGEVIEEVECCFFVADSVVVKKRLNKALY